MVLLSKKILKQLNSQQEKAVKHRDGPLLVLAGAGSGKTRVLTFRIAYLIDEYQVNPRNILAVTFTNKAAEEMNERVSKLLGGFNRDLIISTFHSFCVRILRKQIKKIGYDNNFVIYDTSDQKSLIRDVLKELDMDKNTVKPGVALATISRAKNELLNPEAFESEAHGFFDKKVSKVYSLYQEKLQQNNALDFGDLIMKTVELLEKNPLVSEFYQERFKYILIDEYQDINTAQYRLGYLLTQKYHNICVVGDPDQSIYGFRGADIRNILSFEEDYPEAKIVKLEQNYRSKENILEAAHSVIANNQSRKEKKLWTDRGQGEALNLYEAQSGREEADYVCRNIKELTNNRYNYGDIAILYRTNSQSRLLEEALMKYNIPYQIVAGTKFYDRMEIKDILAYLRVIYNSDDDISLLRIINKPSRGIGAGTIGKLQNYAQKQGISLYRAGLEVKNNPELNGAYQKRVEKFFVLMERFKDKKDQITLTGLLDLILSETGYKRKLKEKDTEKADDRLENIKELYSVIEEFMKVSENNSLSGFLEEVALLSDIDDLEDKNRAVVLMTMHAAKGLEFPAVFITGMEEGLFPHANSFDSKEEIEEERRLCYVGITRAMDVLYLTRAKMRSRFGEFQQNPPSRFLSEIPEELFTDFQEMDSYIEKSEEISGSDVIKSSKYNVGDEVIHSKWGKGVITDIKYDDYLQLTVKFKKGVARNLSADYAPLQKV